MRIYLIRHSMTKGNKEKRYIGTTDESLCLEGIQLLEERKGMYPEVTYVYVSPMKRCVQTAEIIYPEMMKAGAYSCNEKLRECDFGLFENHNYIELSGCPEYQAWIDSGGTIGFPGGENQKAFCDRVQTAFEACIRDDVMPKACNWGQTYAGQNAAEKEFTTAMVVHGGTIMAILSKWAMPHQDYFHWQVKNGCGYEFEMRNGEIVDDYSPIGCS